MDSISVFVLHAGNLRLLETLIVKNVEFLKQMIGTVQIIKTIICEHHHPALKALQQKGFDDMRWKPAVSLNTNTRIKRMVCLYRQKIRYFSVHR